MRTEAQKPSLVIILGPTASGKSELAVQLAERFHGEIVNADSMQVYCGMEIGTAKPSAEMRRRVPHHLIDIVEPDIDFSAADFRNEAARAIADITGRGRTVFIAGGTGLYIKALLQGLVDSPSGAGSVRRELEEKARTFGSEALLRELAQVDPVTAGRLHPNDLVRIVRALEVYRLTGRPISRERSEHGFAGDYYRTLKIGLTMERGELYERIDRRVDGMIAAGLEGEVRTLLGRGFSPRLKALRAIGYRQMCAYLSGEYGLDEAIRLIKRDTRHYAKRQLTWFKTDNEIYWVEYSENFASICEHVIDFLVKGEVHGKGTLQHSGPVSEPVAQGEG
ncbi:MAG TPA: tRNA (adenosine(37)-N6)-dimethylallyltransferase MiaA [Geobacteraceae bacterium]|nr:tRNA (adenosine(37)-N6)-dimethylallyltransferase MiaA [Geobacteraceae bacterium]